VPDRQVVAVGDIFVDYIGDLTDPEYENVLGGLINSMNVFTSVDIKVGGAGVQFAIASKRAGFKTSTLLGKIGGQLDEKQKIIPDPPGDLVIEYLKQHDVHPLLAIDPRSKTGQTVIIFLPGDRRLMLSDPQANTLLSSADLSLEMKSAVRQADLVHVSGYALLQKNRRTAILELMRCAKEGAAKVALDIVPHDIYKFLSFDQLCSDMATLTDWVIVDISTAHQLVGLGQLEQISASLVDQILGILTVIYPSVSLHLNPGHAIVVDEGEYLEYRAEYQPGVASRGQSARAQAELLYWRLNI